MGSSDKRVLLVDGNNYTYRGYYAIKEDMYTRDGVPTKAVRGFFTILHTDLRILRPTHLAVSFDRTPSARRLAIHPEYKGTRTHSDSKEVKPQMRMIRKLLRAAGIPVLGVKGEESDDILSTLAALFDEREYEVLISSTDKDFAQLVSSSIKLVEPRTRNILGPRHVQTKFGVRPDQMHDFLCLMGDKIDNVPGVKNVAAKTASKLLGQYDTLNKIIKAARRGEMTPALRRNLLEFKDSGQIGITRELIRLDKAVNIKFHPSRFSLRKRERDDELIESLCHELELAQTQRLIMEL